MEAGWWARTKHAQCGPAGGPSRLACDCGLRSRQLQLLAHDGDGLALECRTAVAASSGRFVKLRQASSSEAPSRSALPSRRAAGRSRVGEAPL